MNRPLAAADVEAVQILEPEALGLGAQRRGLLRQTNGRHLVAVILHHRAGGQSDRLAVDERQTTQ